MARFPEHILEDIRNRLNIVDVVSEFVSLKKTGQGYQGLCPFHSEKTPSFHVHPEKQIFHCFGCHKGGNAFTFLMGVQGWTFPETVKKLAERTGVELPRDNQYTPKRSTEPTPLDARILAANEWAAKYFAHMLFQGRNAEPLKYLKSRGLGEKTLQKFRIGYAPEGWNNLLLLMLKRGFTLRELIQAGLVVEKGDSPQGGYDRFRHRILFPIANKDGQVLGFGARQLDNDPKQPKYLNSPESSLFSKRNILYGFFENQRGIRLRNEAIIVEGYMDVAGLYEAGVNNAIATMGTAFTEEHAQFLRGITRKVVTVFDADRAGTDAARRSAAVFLEAGIFAKDLTLPDGLDPDEYVVKYGAESFYDLCEKAPRQVTKFLKEVASEGPLSEEKVAQWLEKLTPLLVATRRLPDRAVLWDNVSLVLGVSVDSLESIAEGARIRTPDSQKDRTPQRGTPAPLRKPALAPKSQPPEQRLEREFFLASLTCPEGLRAMPATLWRQGFLDRKLAGYLDALIVTEGNEAFSNQLAELLKTESETELLEGAAPLFFERETRPKFDLNGLTAIAERLLEIRKNKQIQSLTTMVKLSQRLGNESEQLALLEKIKALRSTRASLDELPTLLSLSNDPASGLAKHPPEN